MRVIAIPLEPKAPLRKRDAGALLTGGVPPAPSIVYVRPLKRIAIEEEDELQHTNRLAPWFLTGGVPPPPTTSWLRKPKVGEVPDVAQFYANQFGDELNVKSRFTPPAWPLLLTQTQLFVIPLFVSSSGTVFTPSFIATQDMQLFIAGQEVSWMESTLNIDLILGQVGKASFSIFSTTTYRPNVYDEVVFYRKSIRRFGGFVQSVQDNLVGSLNAHILMVQCVDYNGILDRVIVAKLYTVSIGGFAWIIIFDLIQVYLKQFGISFAGFNNSGAFVGQVLFHYVTLANAIAQLVAAAPSAASFWIDSHKLAHFALPGSATPSGFGVAPYSLSDTSGNYQAEGPGLSVTPDGTLYRNKQWILPSANVLSLRTETFVGDGSTTGFFTLYVLSKPPVVSVTTGIVTTNQIVATLGGPYPPGWTWYFIPDGQGVFQRPGYTPLSPSDTLTVSYPNPFALAISVENDTEIARVGLVEAILQPQNVFDLVTAEALASGLLAAYCPNVPLVVTFLTNEQLDPNWLSPGMTITASKTIPSIPSQLFTVQEVNSQEEKLAVFRHTVTLRSNGGTLDTQTSMLTLSQGALAATNNNATEAAAFDIGVTVQGITNPGLSTGAIATTYIFRYDGVFSYWSILFQTTPPVGASIVIDALLNGVSILPAASALKIVLPDSQTTEEQGYLFLSPNLAYKKGDVLTLNVIQVGLTTPGSDGVVSIVGVR